ncbi:Uma2 family endonuclease [[Phormidium] sp. ETS-05]|uniref:Uma2 family endonuclease n=1 Tax=[Phormidium] sp. ETS-05 TaxID=222819 RepID=UPI0018EEEC90|nr:Uma2 family endonuclease [[Phormidium] sp. ETS-05]
MTIAVLEPVAEPILVEGLTWREFKAVAQLLDRPGIRLSFLAGVLEIRKMPGRQHEIIKKRIAALLETYLEIKGFDFTPTGAMNLENEAEAVKREADESYELQSDRDRPDLAIEVAITSGGIDKLEAYKRLQIPEVGIWQKGQLFLFGLTAEGYQPLETSALLPELDMALFDRCLNYANHALALREFRQGISP